VIVATPPQGNYLENNVFYAFLPILAKSAATFPQPVQFRFIAMQSEGRYEAWCAYHPIASGKYLKKSIKRPSSEHTLYNKNVAIAYVTYRLVYDLLPSAKKDLDVVMASLGLNPENKTLDMRSPIGVGNYVANTVIQERHRDGINQLGDEGGVQYNRMNYSDYTKFEPINTHFQIHDPDAWQPLIITDKMGRPVVQSYYPPQYEYLKTIAINASTACIPDQIDRYDKSKKLYKKKVSEVLDAQENLSEYQKMVSEFFDNKLMSFHYIGDYLIGKHYNYSVDQHTVFHFLVNGVINEASSPVWKLKTKYNSARPYTAIRFLKGDKNINAWGGPGRGIVQMKGREWQSYLPTAPFPDYPSGTSCLCAAWLQASSRFFNTDVLNYSITFPTGSSVIEPGYTPHTNITVHYATFEQASTECMYSRLWSGVHFKQAILEGKNLCKPYGDVWYNKVSNLLQGK